MSALNKKVSSNNRLPPKNNAREDNIYEITTIDSMFEIPDLGNGINASSNEIAKTNDFLQLSARPVEINKLTSPNDLNIKFMGMKNIPKSKYNYDCDLNYSTLNESLGTGDSISDTMRKSDMSDLTSTSGTFDTANGSTNINMTSVKLNGRTAKFSEENNDMDIKSLRTSITEFTSIVLSKLSNEINIYDNLRPEDRRFGIHISEPKWHKGIGSYFVRYKITVSTDKNAYPNREYSIYRRYNQFYWLYNELSFQFPGVIIPGLPEKNYVDHFTDELIESRMRGLEKFIKRIENHPCLSESTLLRNFLTTDEETLRIFMEEANASKPTMFTQISNWVESKIMEYQNSGLVKAERLEKDYFVDALRENVMTIEKVSEVISSRSKTLKKCNKAIAKQCNKLSYDFNSLSHSEITGSDSNLAISEFANMFDKASAMHKHHIDVQAVEFVGMLAESLQSVKSAKHAAMALLEKELHLSFILTKMKIMKDKCIKDGTSFPQDIEIQCDFAEKEWRNATAVFIGQYKAFKLANAADLSNISTCFVKNETNYHAKAADSWTETLDYLQSLSREETLEEYKLPYQANADFDREFSTHIGALGFNLRDTFVPDLDIPQPSIMSETSHSLACPSDDDYDFNLLPAMTIISSSPIRSSNRISLANLVMKDDEPLNRDSDYEPVFSDNDQHNMISDGDGDEGTNHEETIISRKSEVGTGDMIFKSSIYNYYDQDEVPLSLSFSDGITNASEDKANEKGEKSAIVGGHVDDNAHVEETEADKANENEKDIKEIDEDVALRVSFYNFDREDEERQIIQLNSEEEEEREMEVMSTRNTVVGHDIVEDEAEEERVTVALNNVNSADEPPSQLIKEVERESIASIIQNNDVGGVTQDTDGPPITPESPALVISDQFRPQSIVRNSTRKSRVSVGADTATEVGEEENPSSRRSTRVSFVEDSSARQSAAYSESSLVVEESSRKPSLASSIGGNSLYGVDEEGEDSLYDASMSDFEYRETFNQPVVRLSTLAINARASTVEDMKNPVFNFKNNLKKNSQDKN